MGRRFALAAVAILAVAGVGGLVLGGLGVVRVGGPAALGPPRFMDETATSGIDQLYDGEDFFVGGGVAVFDCDGDAAPEVYVAGGSGPAGLYRNESPPGGALAFEAVRAPETDLTGVTGGYPIDIDGDGLTDLAVLRRGENVLLRGVGDCRFERANETWSFNGGNDWSTAFSATWEGDATLPTLAIGNYVDLTATSATGLTRASTCADNELFRPAPGGTAYAAATPLSPGWCTLSVLFSDWDRSGRRDLRMSNDRHYYVDGEEQLWRIEPGQDPHLYTADEGWARMQIWGMGIASYDLTDDGYPEVFLTSQGDNKLQTLAGGVDQPRYSDIALRRGATAAQPFAGGDALPSTAWHPEFQDVNNDGFVDLFISKGNVNVMPDYAQKDPSNLLLGQPHGTFTEGAEEAGILSFARGRGAALADFNMDGLLDLIEVNYGAPVKLWRNVGLGDAGSPAPMGHWTAVQLVQDGPNHAAIGAWIEVRAGDRILRREVTIGGGHAGGQLGWIHFGLGRADTAEIRVQWPDGETGPWLRINTDRFQVIERGANGPRIIEPPTG